MPKKREYPENICYACAIANGGKWLDGHMATFHIEYCGWCGKIQPVTEPRDYGYPKFTIKRSPRRGGKTMKLATIPKPDSLGEYKSLPGRVRDALYDLDMAERSYREALQVEGIKTPDEDTL